MIRKSLLLWATLALVSVVHASVNYELTTGTTSAVLNTSLISSAAGLTFVSANGTVKSALPGGLGFGFAPSENFVFSLSPGLTPVSGGISHLGTLTFDSSKGQITIGDFFIGFNPARANATDSGFFLRDDYNNANLVLFDLSKPTVTIESTNDSVVLRGVDLLVAPEFASFLLTDGLASSNLTGADVGSAQINAFSTAVPEPSAAIFPGGLAACLIGSWLFRRRYVAA